MKDMPTEKERLSLVVENHRKFRLHTIQVTINYVITTLLLLHLVMCSSYPGKSDAASYWEWRDPLPQGNQLNAIAFSGKRYVSVGEGGSILTSEDGKKWTTSQSGTHKRLTSIVWTGTSFVIVGYRTILTSPDGLTWSASDSIDNSFLLSVACGTDRLIAVGCLGAALISPNGIVWQKSERNTGSELRSVVWTGTLFVAVGQAEKFRGPGNGKILTSIDGISWEDRTPAGTDVLNSVTWNGQLAVAVGPGNLVLVSQDCRTWRTVLIDKGDPLCFSAWTGQEFIAGGLRDSVFFSRDGLKWVPKKTGMRVDNAQWVNGRAFAFTSRVYESSDWVTWSPAMDTARRSALRSIVSSGSRYVAVGYDGFAQTSADGHTWTNAETGIKGSLDCVIWARKRFVAVGTNGWTTNAITSTDGFHWEPCTGLGNARLAKLAYTGNIFVGVGGTIATSVNGIDWDIQVDSAKAMDVACSRSTIVVTRWDGRVLTSSDGKRWTLRDTPTPLPLRAITWNGKQFLATAQVARIGQPVKDENTVVYSVDGVNWEGCKANIANEREYTLLWTGRRYVLVGMGGDMTSSLDGKHWESYGYCPSTFVFSMLWTGKELIAVGNGILACRPDPSVW
jgi:hypothetical protein